MSKFDFISKFPLNQKFGFQYKGMAYDGKYFYFTCPDMKLVYVYDKHIKYKGFFKLTRKFKYICFDSREDCFWATTKSNNVLYKLNSTFLEIGDTKFEPSDLCTGDINDLSFDSFTNRIIVAFSNCVLLVNKSGNDKPMSIVKSYKSIITSVVSIAPTLLITYTDGNKKSLEIYDNKIDVISSFDIEDNCIIQSIVFDPCEEFFNNKYQFYFLCNDSDEKQSICKWVYDAHKNCMYVDFSNYYILENSYIKVDKSDAKETLIYIENSLDELVGYQNKIKKDIILGNSEGEETKELVNMSISKLQEMKSNFTYINK